MHLNIETMVRISGHAQVIHTKISGDMQIGDYAKVCGNQDYVEIRGLLFEEHPIFFFRLVSGKIGVQFQDFSGDLAQFKRYVQKIPKMKTRKELWMLLCLIQYQFQELLELIGGVYNIKTVEIENNLQNQAIAFSKTANILK